MTRAEGARTEGAVFQSAAAGLRAALGRTEEDTDRDPRLAVTPCLDLRSLRDGENGEGGGNGPPITTEERRNGGERQERNRDEAERARIEGVPCSSPLLPAFGRRSGGRGRQKCDGP